MQLFGKWDAALTALILFMIIDYSTGWILAAVFKKSPKTKSGALDSRVGLKGFCKKIMILLMVLVSVQIDNLLGTVFVRDATIIGFCANELLSIVENAGLMGAPIPPVIAKAIDALQGKAAANG